MKKYVMVLLALVMVFSCCTVCAEDDEYEYEDDTYYSEETDENEWDDEENEEYEETDEYDENDEDDTEEWEEEDEDSEDWEYSEESYEETVSQVSDEESSEPVLKRDPLAFQQETDVLLPVYAEVSESVSESSSTEKAVPESAAEEKVLNIADLAKPESKSTALSVWGIILWIMIGMMTVGAAVILANTKTQGAFRRRRYYRAAKRMTKKHIG